MKDEAHKLTDDILNDLIDDIDKIYSDIQKDLYRELEKGLDWDKINSITDKKKRLLEAKKRKRLEMMIERVAKIIQSKNEIAAALIQDKEIDIFALNYNWGGYYVENQSGINIAFTVMNRRATEELLKQTTPVFTKMAYLGLKDRKEIIRDLRRELTKAITRGESIGEIAKRVDKVTNKNNYGSKRIAVTETTRIESSGREKAFKEGENAGLNLKKEWISTIDNRTRKSHRRLMGKKVGLDDKFSNGLRYPGDPEGKATEVINCRCTHVADFVGLNKSKEELELDSKLKKMSFDEWMVNKYGKTNNKKRK